MLQALAEGETDPAALAKLAAPRLRATPEQLCDAFQACPTLHPVWGQLLKLTLEELRVIEDHLEQLDQQMADLLVAHHDAVQRLAEVPGLGVDSAQQIIAGVGATAATFPSPKHLASWMGASPGNEESAGVNYSHRCPKGNRQMRRVLNQAANAAVKAPRRSIIRSIPHAPDQTVARPRWLHWLVRSRRSHRDYCAHADFHCVSAAGGRLEQLRKSFSAASQEGAAYPWRISSRRSPELQIMLVAGPRNQNP
jgi:transposase